jgi:ubiquinone/menaquinone biosynthesis C-methylase UbiE
MASCPVATAMRHAEAWQNGARTGIKKMRDDPDHAEYLRAWSETYEQSNYEQGLSGLFLTKSHQWAERAFGSDARFAKVLEVGAGTGVHFRFVRHAFDEYWITDLNTEFLERAVPTETPQGKGEVRIDRQDAMSLTFPDDTFDRVIAAHVLEHLVEPHLRLREWIRVLKPGGVLSLVLPCDPGLAWRIGRAVGSRGKFVRAGIDYDYWMAREHVNSINNLVSFVRHYFDDVDEAWMPFRVPSMDLNLFYIAHVRV